MSIKAQAQAVAAEAGRIGGEWRNIEDEVWSGRSRLFVTKDIKIAEHVVRLHNLIIPVSNLLTRALQEVQDMRKIMRVGRGL